jgi:hypothetical protein
MNAKRIFAVAMLCACFTSGCYTDMRLKPVSGPLAAEGHPPVPKGKFAEYHSRSMTVNLPDGEVFRGILSRLARSPIRGMVIAAGDIAAIGTDAGIVAAGASRTGQTPSCATGSAIGEQPPCDLGPAWTAAWGRDFYEDYILPAKTLEQATLTGNQGAILRVEMYWRTQPYPDMPELFGVAQDNKGNNYKVTVGPY